MIVPCFNVAPYVAQTIQSLRRNAAPGIEFLLVDDASTDATTAILADHVERLPGGRVITAPSNVGLSAARNLGLAAATGEYLAFLDGDDFVAPGYFSTLVSVIERLGCDMVRTDHVRVRGRQREVHRINHGPRGTVCVPREAILPIYRPTSVDAPNAWAGISHRRLLESGALLFNERLRTCEDRAWIWRLHLRAESFAVVGMVGVYYRRDVGTSLTQITDDRQFDFIPAFDQIVDDVLNDRDAVTLLPKAVRSYCAIMHHHLARRNRYEPHLAVELMDRSGRALRGLPADTLNDVMIGMDKKRTDLLTRVMLADSGMQVA